MAITATSRVRLSWPQEQHVPLRGSYRVYGGIGAVSYDSALADGIVAWPNPQVKIGLGRGTMGGGRMGIGDAQGCGMGRGALGYGPLGIGGAALSLDLADLADGTWHFAVVAADAAGNEETPAAVTTNIALAGEPDPPTGLRATAYAAAGGGTLTLTWTRSPDDE